MKKSIKLMSLLIAVFMLVGIVPFAVSAETEQQTPLVIGYDTFSQKFSPYYGDTAYDMDISDLTQVSLLTTDRAGGIIMKAIEGETVDYNGVPYEYTGIADWEVTIDEEADKTVYNIKIRDDVVFSDGEPLTADDIIFTYYAFIDPDYTGSSTLYSVPIVGIQDYRSQTSPEIFEKYSANYAGIIEAGQDHEWSDADPWTQEQQDYVWNTLNTNWDEGIPKLTEYIVNNYTSYADLVGLTPDELLATPEVQPMFAAYLWGFGDVVMSEPPVEEPAAEETEEIVEETAAEETVEETAETAETTAAETEEPAAEEPAFEPQVIGYRYEAPNGDVMEWIFETDGYPTNDDFIAITRAAYDGDVISFLTTELEGSVDPAYNYLEGEFIYFFGSSDPEMTEGGVPFVEGIKKIGDYEVEVTTEGFDASAIYKLGVAVTPLHYYGQPELYDYENNMFGLEYRNHDHIKSKTEHPMGAGPYVFDRYENKIVYMTANENYYKGAPLTKAIQFRETGVSDRVAGIVGATIDIAVPSLSNAVVDEIQSHNDNGELTGSIITTDLVDNLGYGYIGLNAMRVKVGEDPGSVESKNLRKGFATIFSRLRDLTVNSYYGERASVINYPISNTSWAAPRPADEGYRLAFSLDVEGNEIYAEDMDDDARLEAAVEAAKGYFIAAGYTFDEASGKFTAAPEGAKMSYELVIPADGQGDHPSFLLVTNAKEVLQSIGLDLEINDPADSNILWQKINAAEQEMWAAAWGATIDPDMYQIYYSNNIVGNENSTESNHYHIQDAELDELIMEARTSADQGFRKNAYKAALDIVMDWAVEIPVYQRQNAIIFSTERVALDTITPDITTFWGWMAEIEKLELVANQ